MNLNDDSLLTALPEPDVIRAELGEVTARRNYLKALLRVAEAHCPALHDDEQSDR